MLDKILNKYLTEEGEGGGFTDAGGAETDNMIAKYALPIGFKKHKNLLKRQLKKKKKKQPIDEAAKAMSTDDIINALGGDAFYKKTFTSVAAAYKYTLQHINKILSTFGLSQKDIPLQSIETHLRKIIKEKR